MAPDARLDFVGQIQHRTAEHQRLLGLCRNLQRTHRCPGECVLSEQRHDRILRNIGWDDGPG
jgi:hypothetical protein